MNVFDLRDRLIGNYAEYAGSFIQIRDERIAEHVEARLKRGVLWPDPLIQLNPSFEPGEWIDELVDAGVVHNECRRIFRKKPEPTADEGPLRLHRHQGEAVRVARAGHNYVLTTGTGSGKSLAYIVPIVDHVLRNGSGKGIQAIVVYPMNALANSQEGELRKFIHHGYPSGKGPVRFARYTGQERDEEKQRIIAEPPDILLTNYVMLELLLTRPYEKGLVRAAKGLRFLVLDELHTYRGRQGADVAMLVRRARDAFEAPRLQCVGTSATIAGVGTQDEQRAQVAAIASALFGAPVWSEDVIGETLRRATPERDFTNTKFLAALRARIEDRTGQPPSDYAGFVADPLSSWIESTFGLTTEPGTGRLIRTMPQSITGDQGAAGKLSERTGVSVERCVEAIQEHLLASYRCERNPETGFPAFAFRLHQFISRGDTVYGSLESEAARHLTLNGQQYVPGDRSRVLLPLVFCRECGQEYYCVAVRRDPETRQRVFAGRELSDRAGEDDEAVGFLHASITDPWPEDAQHIIERVPEDWLEEKGGAVRVRKSNQDDLPKALRIGLDGREGPQGFDCHFVKAPFRFCLRCGVTYGARQTSDFGKLASLGTEGRSTATTVLSLSAIQYLRASAELPERARKLLSFTDNRQDASLQAGHFNDFIEVGLLRAALYKAVKAAGADGLEHDVLVQRVFDALDLPLLLYASDPDVKYQALEQTRRALRSVLGYRLYRDLLRGWRITSPNLEQCGLLEIRYLSLDEVCADEDVWKDRHPALVTATPATRRKVAKTLLDFMRRELAIKVDSLTEEAQERMQQQSSQRLIPPWAIDERERLERARTLYPRSTRPFDRELSLCLSSRSGFGVYLGRKSTFEEHPHKLALPDRQRICCDLLEALRTGGVVERTEEPPSKDDVPGYQIVASSMLWVAGDGSRAFHDPIRMPRQPESGARTNPFFRDFYGRTAIETKGLEAHEHTAQVDYELRIEREGKFRSGALPILYCSPTMELGVDISELNVVNLRNVPPTPANYAQRSGRAGRSGQPALVFTYCSGYSPHDQYFFRRPERMVAGAVSPPRLELANEDLLRAHVHAIWLAEAGLGLGTSLKDILDMSGEEPTLDLLERVHDEVQAAKPREHALTRARAILEGIRDDLEAADWYSPGWLAEVFTQLPLVFNQACDRWRGLYRAASAQFGAQNRIIKDASRTLEEKRTAKRLRAEAEGQIELLTSAHRAIEADFYSYRYFASEGFLPGYNFPRLPLSAYIPGRQRKGGRDEFLSRPRFLAISEFGPRAILYHEGSRYRINKVILPVDTSKEDVLTSAAKQCGNCGYLHPIRGGDGLDLCERCGQALGQPLTDLFRLQNVATKRADRINSDEEERLRLGYQVQAGFRFAEHDGQPSYRVATVAREGRTLATLTYGHASTLWRINLGWRRRANQNQLGFVLDIERGYWARNVTDVADDDDDPTSKRTRRVIPFVEDRKNCLLFEPATGLPVNIMASLQAALKNAIQVEFQLEESELAAEPLPAQSDRRLILFYEAAEGGAGALRRLIDHAQALARVARQALALCHFDPDTGDDHRRAPRATEDCEAACYDCLMSYVNQPDHPKLDRKGIRDLLRDFAAASVAASPAPLPRAAHLAQLRKQCDSDLERTWLDYVEAQGLRLPSRAQVFIDGCKTRPDFVYDASQVAIYVDGPVHEYPDRKQRDEAQTAMMEDAGYTVLRFADESGWASLIAGHPNVFGKPS